MISSVPSRHSYCAQDSAVTFDLHNALIERHNNNTLSLSYQKFLTHSLKWMNKIHVDKSLIRSHLKKSPITRLNYSKVLKEKKLLKPNDLWKPWKLDNLLHSNLTPENKILVKRLIKNRNSHDLQKLLTSLVEVSRFAFFVSDFEPLLRSSNLDNTKLSVNDLTDLSPFIPNSRVYTITLGSLIRAWGINISDEIVHNKTLIEMWLHGYSPTQVARKTPLNVSEVTSIFIVLNDLNPSRTSAIETLYSDLYHEKSVVKNPLTGNKFHLTSDIDETRLLTLINNEYKSLKIIEKANSLSQPFLINKNKLIIQEN